MDKNNDVPAPPSQPVGNERDPRSFFALIVEQNIQPSCLAYIDELSEQSITGEVQNGSRDRDGFLSEFIFFFRLNGKRIASVRFTHTRPPEMARILTTVEPTDGRGKGENIQVRAISKVLVRDRLTKMRSQLKPLPEIDPQ